MEKFSENYVFFEKNPRAPFEVAEVEFENRSSFDLGWSEGAL